MTSGGITQEPVRGSVPPPWFWALSGAERIHALSQGYVAATPFMHLTGFRPTHVGPGSGTWTMPISERLRGYGAQLEVTLFAADAAHGVAMTAAAPGATVQPVHMDFHHFRPARSRGSSLMARGSVVNANPFFVYAQVLVEDSDGRQICSASCHGAFQVIDPPPPPAPDRLQRVEEPHYATPDPYQRSLTHSRRVPEVPSEESALGYFREDAWYPFMDLADVRFEQSADGAAVLHGTASEWFCMYDRTVSCGYLASCANHVAAATTSGHRGFASWVGLTQSVQFWRPLRADGRPFRMKSTARDTGPYKTGYADLLDADEEHIATASGMVAFIDPAQRRTYAQPDVSRVLSTLLFTDIVDSTGHAERLGDAGWGKLLDEHHRLMRQEIVRRGGTEVDTAGDGFFVRFETPAHALQCARAAAAAVRALGIEIRAGVHTGECEVNGRSVSGLAVHIASRVASTAQPNEVLVTSTVKALVMGSGLTFEDRGEHELKGVPDAWRLFALVD